jgi:hypothetical protein
MKLARTVAAATSAFVVAGLLAGCGDVGASAPSSGPARPGTATSPADAAVRPTGATARAVAYRCTSGRDGNLTVDVPDLADLAETVNRLQACEHDHGVSHATLVVTCRSGPLVIRLTGTDGRLAQPSDEALCLT